MSLTVWHLAIFWYHTPKIAVRNLGYPGVREEGFETLSLLSLCLYSPCIYSPCVSPILCLSYPCVFHIPVSLLFPSVSCVSPFHTLPVSLLPILSLCHWPFPPPSGWAMVGGACGVGCCSFSGYDLARLPLARGIGLRWEGHARTIE